MNSRERLLTALNHREPDHLPFDLGSTQVTGIHVVAYRRLREYLGLPRVQPQLCDTIQQTIAGWHRPYMRNMRRTP
jgi:uroporphyrinogen decarboxylase